MRTRMAKGQPAKTAMSGGTQWIEWKYDNLETLAVATKKESSISGPDVPPPFKTEPAPVKEFFDHYPCSSQVWRQLHRRLDGRTIGHADDNFEEM